MAKALPEIHPAVMAETNASPPPPLAARRCDTGQKELYSGHDEATKHDEDDDRREGGEEELQKWPEIEI